MYSFTKKAQQFFKELVKKVMLKILFLPIINL